MKCLIVEPGKPAAPANLSFEEMQHTLGFVSMVRPFEDPICLVHDDDGIANGRVPNRIIHNQIMPGVFYVVEENKTGELIDLSEDLEKKYLEVFHTPDLFPPGKWKISYNTEETGHSVILSMTSEWVSDIPSVVFTQLMKIRSSGAVNMFDVGGVEREAFNRGFYELVNFIEEDKERYFKLILTGNVHSEK